MRSTKLVLLPALLILWTLSGCDKSITDSNIPAGDTTRVLYTIKPNGELGWYRHIGFQSGLRLWANNGQFLQVGEDWHLLRTAFRAGNNILYGIRNTGELGWYLHTGWESGSRTGWVNNGQFTAVSDQAWDLFTHVFSGGGQVIYAVKSNGELGWFRHTGQPAGSNNWASNGEFLKVGEGFDQYTRLFSPGNGILYGIKPNGDLHWYNHLGYTDGTDTWANGGLPVRVGEDWNRFSLVFPAGNVIYAVLPTGELGWYRHIGQSNGTPSWANNGQFRQVGEDWDVFINAF